MTTIVIVGIVVPAVLAFIAKSISWMKDNYVSSDDNDKEVNINSETVFDHIREIEFDIDTNPAFDYISSNASYDMFKDD